MSKMILNTTKISKIQLNTSMVWTLQGDRIVFYATDYELRRTLNVENSKEVFKLFQYLQEPRNIEEIENFSQLSQIQLKSLINYMFKKGYFKLESKDLNPADVRISHLLDALPAINGTLILNNIHHLKVAIIGVGTMGSYAVDGLVKLGIAELTLIDADRVEAKNVSAQNYTLSDVGAFKVDCLASKYDAEKVNVRVKKLMLHSYDELKKIIDLSKVDFLITSDDDYQLNRDIWCNVFNEYPSLKCITGGYSLFKSSAFMMTKDNVKSYCLAMDKTRKTLNSSMIINNDGTIFNAMMYGLVIPKLIFDDITHIGKSTTATFDYLQNNFFLGNLHDFEYYKSFQKDKQKNNILFSQQMSSSSVWFKKDNKQIGVLSEKFNLNSLSMQEKAYIGEQTIQDLPIDLKSLRANYIPTYPIKAAVIKQPVMEYVKTHFNKEIFKDVKHTFDEELILVDPGIYGIKRNYTERTKSGSMIYMNNGNPGTEALEVIHELFHVVSNHFGNDPYKHESFVLKRTIDFIKGYSDTKISKNLGRQLINQYKSTYIDFQITAELEKAILLDSQDIFLSWFVKAGKHIQKEKLLALITRYIKPQQPFFTLRYLLAYNDNKTELEKLESWCAQ